MWCSHNEISVETIKYQTVHIQASRVWSNVLDLAEAGVTAVYSYGLGLCTQPVKAVGTGTHDWAAC